jgi:hypothetical protein
MKKLLLLIPLFLLTGYKASTNYMPVFMTRTALEASVQLVDSAMPISNPGRIYRYGNWVMLVENYAGIHLIDNEDPAHPQRKGFLRVPGCLNLAVGNGFLYVDNAVDLVGIRLDLVNMTCREMSRVKNTLPEIISPDGWIPRAFSRSERPKNTEIIQWVKATSPYYYDSSDDYYDF